MAVILDDAGRVLLVRDADERGRWAPPGGMLEPGETPDEAVIRELHEELGVDIAPGPLVAVYTLRVPGAAYGLRFVFRSAIISGEPFNAAPDEIADFGWFATEALPEPMSHSGPSAVADTAAGHVGVVREITVTISAR